MVIRDAHVTVFAVQPSTRVWRSPTDQPLYVAPDGVVLGVVDYRIEPPAANGTRVHDHRITETRLVVDDDVVASGAGSHTPVLRYSDLDALGRGRHTLTVEATIVVELSVGNTTTRTVEQLTVRDSVRVTVYDPRVEARFAKFPDGEAGLALTGSQPWAGYAVGQQEATGVWRFYTARDERWDTLNVSTRDGVTSRVSPALPLQVYAYPARKGVSASGDLTVVDVVGDDHAAPVIPPTIDLDVVRDRYTESSTIVAESDAEWVPDSTIVVHGIVRGTDTSIPLSTVETTTVRQSTLTITVRNATDQTVTVGVDLRDAETGAPIQTAGRAGAVVVADTRIETNHDGTATLTLPRPAGVLTARYDPEPWWESEDAFLGSSDTVYVRGTTIPVAVTLFEFGVPVGLFLLAVFLIDRITGWRVWPPWRGV